MTDAPTCRLVGIGSVGFVLAMPSGGFTGWELQDSIELCLGDLILVDRPNATGRQQLLHLGHGRMFDAYGQSGVSGFKAACRSVHPIRKIKLD